MTVNIMAGQRTPLRNKGLIRPYQGKPMVNKPLLRHAGKFCAQLKTSWWACEANLNIIIFPAR